jgi:DNA-binding SARP family transcriptional activator
MRWMNRLATTLTVLAVVAGPPLLAAAWLLRHPWRPPTHAQIQAWAQQPMTAGTIIAGCITVAGLAWLLLVVYLARRALARLRHGLRRARHLPLPTPAQMTASSMAGVAAFTLPAIPTGHPDLPPAATGTPHPSDPAGPGRDTGRPAQAQPAGMTLPGGGWIPYRTAAAIAALTAAAWLQRRRHYRPDPDHPRGHHSDPDLQPLPGTVHTISTALAADEPAAGDHPPPPLPPERLPDGILGLTGPGAAAAARGLLVTAALSAATGGTLAPSVCVRPDDLHTLLPDTDPADLVAAGIGCTGDPAPANPPAAHCDHHDESADRVHHPADSREPSDPRSSPVTVIVLGDDPAATGRWHVAADGTATGTGLTQPRRLCSLDQHAATDLLTLVCSRHDHEATVDPQLSPCSTQASLAVPGRGTVTATAAHLTLLGGCHLTVAGEPVQVRRTAGLQILAYLAVHPDGATRGELTHAVWPHLPAATISQRLHTTLADLRKQLRPLLGEDPVTRHDDRYQLNPHAITTDLQPWRTTIHAMTHAVGTTAQQRACRDLVDRFRGELAAGRPWPWLTPGREQIRRGVIDACSTLADRAEPAEALTWLQHAITVDPYNEPLHHQAADLLYAAGDHTGAAELISNLHRRLSSSGSDTPG